MKALPNTDTQRGEISPPHTGLASNILPEAQCSQVGVSSDYVPKACYDWFVFCLIYNRIQKANDIIKRANVEVYLPMYTTIKVINVKKKCVQEPLLSNIIFCYTTREQAYELVKQSSGQPALLKFYLNKTEPLETSGKHPPLTIGYDKMMNFIRLKSFDNEHVKVIDTDHCYFKTEDKVKIIDGDSKGIKGRVAIVMGQQRVVTEIEGLCLVATAYIPTVF